MRRLGVIMAGGSGERFWPLSRKSRPKQLLRLTPAGETMLGEAVDRARTLCGAENVWIAAAPHLRAAIAAALEGFPSRDILAEPHKRNTAGCLVWVAANLLARDSDARGNWSMAVVTADHRITPTEGFERTARAALETVERDGGLATIGIPPTRPETGFGYIEVGPSASDHEGIAVHAVQRFREKPSLEDARAYVESGRFLWNSGMFFWTLDGFLAELEVAAPVLAAAIPDIAHALATGDEAEASRVFEALPSISIDYALMEKARRVFVARADFEWDDLGSWDALDRSFPRDESGNVTVGDTVLVDTRDCVVYSANPQVVTAVVGMEDVVVVVTDDAVLVCPKSRSQEVRRVVEELGVRNPSKV